MKPRYGHIALCVIGGAAVFGAADLYYLATFNALPSLKDVWWLTVIVPFLCGSVVTLGAGGAAMFKRIIGGVVCGGAVGVIPLVASMLLSNEIMSFGDIAMNGIWRIFVFAILTTISVLFTEIRWPEPKVA